MRQMQRTLLALSLFVNSGCSDAPKDDPRDVLKCMQNQKTSDQYLLTTTCEPLDDAKEYHGYWVVSFETSIFSNSESSSLSKLDGFELLVPSKVLRTLNNRDDTRTQYEVKFVGRKSKLPRSHIIVMDEPIYIKLISKIH